MVGHGGRRWVMGLCPGRVHLFLAPLPLSSSLSASWLPRAECVSSAVPFYHDASSWSQSNGIDPAWTKVSEAVSQNKLLSSELFLTGVLVTVMQS